MKVPSRMHGFTLVELIIIVILLGILAVYAAPRLGGLSSYTLAASRSELLEAIRYAQEASMASVDHQYQIDTGGANKYRVRAYDLDNNNYSNVTSPLTGSSPFVADSGDWSGVSASVLTLSFDSRGYPCANVAPCTTPMTTTRTITVSSGGSRTITIEPITGFAYAN
ncbi:prepilin-type N-terminal cleavage/methylation domain-containing protein [Thiohalomonas denitrificans]|uniref:MSHA pilin protein MshC n=1 Tax=Thiohalomonas denitrificans TaxID=415747 RepID=A0A1G5QUA3_9GAMM|nr:prepilin-type N-terminal cleavage/methylation domain-containing protein [Thiohalomonas denitrificans]SCZ65168.1 MSHA pilin protein MshC [Thiohalomonas denitrificans]